MSDYPLAFEYIRSTYNVPAEIGREVIVNGQCGVIVKDCGHHIGVHFDGDKPNEVTNCHPTWEVEYLGIRKLKEPSRGAIRYQEYLNSVCCEAGHSFAFFLGIKGVKS